LGILVQFACTCSGDGIAEQHRRGTLSACFHERPASGRAMCVLTPAAVGCRAFFVRLPSFFWGGGYVQHVYGQHGHVHLEQQWHCLSAEEQTVFISSTGMLPRSSMLQWIC
jgi:hypothetical protein